MTTSQRMLERRRRRSELGVGIRRIHKRIWNKLSNVREIKKH